MLDRKHVYETLPYERRLKPLGVKACFLLRGRVTTCGSSILMDYRADRDAEVVSLLSRRYSPATIDRCSEWCVGNDTLDSLGQSLKWKGVRVGGSTGGGALSVHLGMAKLAIGTDTGGSIRDVTFCFPQMWGFKPSWGLVSREGVIPLCQPLDCVGFLAEGSAPFREVYEALILAIRGVLDTTLTSLENIRAGGLFTHNGPLKVARIDDLVPLVDVVHEAVLDETDLNQLGRLYDLYTGLHLVSNLNRYVHMNYSNLNLKDLNSGLHLKGASYPISSIETQATRRRYYLGQVCFLSPRIRNLVLRQVRLTKGALSKALGKWDVVVHGSRNMKSHYTLIANFLGTPSCSVGEVVYTSTRQLTDFKLLKFVRGRCL